LVCDDDFRDIMEDGAEASTSGTDLLEDGAEASTSDPRIELDIYVEMVMG
jgi:hypothetical protein